MLPIFFLTTVASTLGLTALALNPDASSGVNIFENGTNRVINGSSLRQSQHGSWLGWGAGIYNNRSAALGAVVNSSNVGSLQPKCRLTYAVGESAPPLVFEGVAYYPTWSGLFVALRYEDCKVLWQTNVTKLIKDYGTNYSPIINTASRTTPALYQGVLFIGTQANALLLAIEQRTGRLIDAIQLSDHPFALITQSVTVWQGTVFVGTSSGEEAGAAQVAGYVCCSFIGSMNGVAFRHKHFKLLWSQPMIPANSNFSGAAIWGAQPSIDPSRKQVFIATGNVYSVPPSYDACVDSTGKPTSTDPGNATDPCAPKEVYQEAILALDTGTGHIKWSHQLSPIDAWNVACFPGTLNDACPENPGPDADFGIAPTFVPGSKNTPFGEDTLIIGQKNGNLYALSANNGTLFWALATSPDGILGGLIWGLAVDSTTAYYTAVNGQRVPWKLKNGTALSNGAFGAAKISNGEILWETPVPRNSTSLVQPTVVNDVVLVGVGGPYQDPPLGPGIGSFLSLNKATGEILSEVKLDTYFQGGIAVVNDYVFFGTGYSLVQTPNGSFNVWQLSK